MRAGGPSSFFPRPAAYSARSRNCAVCASAPSMRVAARSISTLRAYRACASCVSLASSARCACDRSSSALSETACADSREACSQMTPSSASKTSPVRARAAAATLTGSSRSAVASRRLHGNPTWKPPLFVSPPSRDQLRICPAEYIECASLYDTAMTTRWSVGSSSRPSSGTSWKLASALTRDRTRGVSSSGSSGSEC